jgi:transposase
MQIELSLQEKADLERQHKRERDGRIKDRIKAVLLDAEGWSPHQIAQALRVHVDTIQNHLEDYRTLKKLKPLNGGSRELLTALQGAELVAHLESHTSTSVGEICDHVLKTYGVRLSIPGMTQWLHRQGFSYKKPAPRPAKADPEKQAAFVAFYQRLQKTTPQEEPILFGDGVHPTMATKVAYGWIRKGVRKPIPTTASRTRLNLFGALNLETMDLIIEGYPTLNSEAMGAYFQKLRTRYPKAPRIHLILDQGPYNVSGETKKAAERWGIALHYLPPYSPNLNPSERGGEVMNEQVRNNRFFPNAKAFREAIFEFFHSTWPTLSQSLVNRINDNFQTLQQETST